MGEKQRQYYMLAFAILFAMLAMFHFLYLAPLQGEKTSQQVKLAQLEQQAEAAEAQISQPKPALPEEMLSQVMERIPVKPYTDQLVKDLEKLQTISHVQIDSVTFGKPEEISVKEIVEKFYPKESDGKPLDLVTQYQNAVADAEKQNNEQTAPPKVIGDPLAPGQEERSNTNATYVTHAKLMALEQLKEAMPDTKIHSLNATIALLGEYQEIYKFVTEMQTLSRYLRVDELSFTSPEKEEYMIPSETRLAVTVKLTSYYAPQFASLAEKLPGVDVERPSGKRNPVEYQEQPNSQHGSISPSLQN